MIDRDAQVTYYINEVNEIRSNLATVIPTVVKLYSEIHVGMGVPTLLLGKPYDWYINISTGVVYVRIPKGNWTTLPKLIGGSIRTRFVYIQSKYKPMPPAKINNRRWSSRPLTIDPLYRDIWVSQADFIDEHRVSLWTEPGLYVTKRVKGFDDIPTKEVQKLPTVRLNLTEVRKLPTARVALTEANRLSTVRVALTQVKQLPTIKVAFSEAKKVATLQAYKIPTLRVTQKEVRKLDTVKIALTEAKPIATSQAYKIPTVRFTLSQAVRIATSQVQRLSTIKTANILTNVHILDYTLTFSTLGDPITINLPTPTPYTHPTGFSNVPAAILEGLQVISRVNVTNEGHVSGVISRVLPHKKFGRTLIPALPLDNNLYLDGTGNWRTTSWILKVGGVLGEAVVNPGDDVIFSSGTNITITRDGRLITIASTVEVPEPTLYDHNLTDHLDVSITSPITGQLIRYTGAGWENWTPNYLTSFTEVDPIFVAWRDANRTQSTFWGAPYGSGGPAAFRVISYNDLSDRPTIPTSFNITSDLLQGGSNSVNAYSSDQSTQRRFYTTEHLPTGINRLSIGSYFFATRLYDGGTRVSVVGHGHPTLTRGAGLTGENYTATIAREWGVDFGGNGVSNQVARSDHNHDSIYAPIVHTHDFDKYTSWLLKVKTGTDVSVASGHRIQLFEGNNVTITQGASTGTTTIQISSQDTIYTHPSKAWVDKANLANAAVISNLTIDSLGHPTNWVTRNLTPADIAAAPAVHTHATLTRGAGLLGNNYNGGTATTWEVNFAGTGVSNSVARSDHNHDTSYSPIGHSHDFDKYDHWKLRVNTDVALNVTTGSLLSFIQGGATTISRTGNDITISSVNTIYTHPTGFSNQPSIALTGGSVISQISINNEGHVTGVTSRVLDHTSVGAAPAVHTHDFDKYSYWNLKVKTGVDVQVNSAHRIQFLEGDNISIVQGTDVGTTTLTISSSYIDNYLTGLSFASGIITASMSGGLAARTVNIDGRYSLLGHSHEALVRGIGLTGLNYDGTISRTWAIDFAGNGAANTVSRSDHNHDTLYSPLVHTHATLTRGIGLTGANYNGGAGTTWAVEFAGSGVANTSSRSDHNHDILYADINHNHDTQYSDINHNHDTAYAPIVHTHDFDKYQAWLLQADLVDVVGTPVSVSVGSNRTVFFKGMGGTYTKVYDSGTSWIVEIASANLALQSLIAGNGLTGLDYNGSLERTWSISFAGSGTANTVARSDHNHTGTYLESFTETDPTVPSHVKDITTTNISSWNAAHSWGDHALAGYSTVTTFLGLTDTPNLYIDGAVSHAGKTVVVNDLGTALTFSEFSQSQHIPNFYVTNLVEFVAAYNNITNNFPGGNIYINGTVVLTEDLSLDLTGINIYGSGHFGMIKFSSATNLNVSTAPVYKIIITGGNPVFSNLWFSGSSEEAQNDTRTWPNRTIFQLTAPTESRVYFDKCAFSNIVCGGTDNPIILLDANYPKYTSQLIHFSSCSFVSHSGSTTAAPDYEYNGFKIKYENIYSDFARIKIYVTGQIATTGNGNTIGAALNNTSTLYNLDRNTKNPIKFDFVSDETAWLGSIGTLLASVVERNNYINELPEVIDSINLDDNDYIYFSRAIDWNNHYRVKLSILKSLMSDSYRHPTDFVSVPTTALSGASVISQIIVNDEGHVTGVSTRNLTSANIGAAAASHTHTSSDITDLDTTNNYLTGVSFASGTLTFTRQGLLDLTCSIDGRYSLSTHSHSWTAITSKPTSFNPDGHGLASAYHHTATLSEFNSMISNATLDAAGSARPASDVYSWAKQSSKPTYSYTEVGAAAASHTHGNITNDGKIGSSSNLSIITTTGGVLTTTSRSGIDTRSTFPPSSHSLNSHSSTNLAGLNAVISDANLDAAGTARPASDVYTWAKASSKPSYSATEVGALPSNHAASNVTTTKISYWDTAYSWGNHSSANYLVPGSYGLGGIANNLYWSTLLTSTITRFNYRYGDTGFYDIPESDGSNFPVVEAGVYKGFHLYAGLNESLQVISAYQRMFFRTREDDGLLNEDWTEVKTSRNIKIVSVLPTIQESGVLYFVKA